MLVLEAVACLCHPFNQEASLLLSSVLAASSAVQVPPEDPVTEPRFSVTGSMGGQRRVPARRFQSDSFPHDRNSRLFIWKDGVRPGRMRKPCRDSNDPEKTSWRTHAAVAHHLASWPTICLAFSSICLRSFEVPRSLATPGDTLLQAKVRSLV